MAEEKQKENGEILTCTFAAMRLKIGDRLQLQPPSSVDRERRFVRLIGYVPNRSFIVTPPQADGLNLMLNKEDSIIVRVFTGHNAYGFSTTVLKVCHYPYDYIHLAFPEIVQKLVIRKAVRVRVRIIASVQNPKLGDPVAGMILDLSATGALISARQLLGDVGDILYINFRLKSNMIESDLTLQAVIRSVSDNLSEAGQESAADAALELKFRHGVEFFDLSVVDAATLKNGIFDLLM